MIVCGGEIYRYINIGGVYILWCTFCVGTCGKCKGHYACVQTSHNTFMLLIDPYNGMGVKKVGAFASAHPIPIHPEQCL